MRLVGENTMTAWDDSSTSADRAMPDTQVPGTNVPVLHLPKLLNYGGVAAPAAPTTAEETGVDPSVLSDLALKLANTVPRITTEWAAEQLRLPVSVVERLFWQLRE